MKPIDYKDRSKLISQVKESFIVLKIALVMKKNTKAKKLRIQQTDIEQTLKNTNVITNPTPRQKIDHKVVKFRIRIELNLDRRCTEILKDENK